MTVPDTVAASHLDATSTSAGAAAEQAANKKMDKYRDLMTTHEFVPIAVETFGLWCTATVEFFSDLGKRLTEATGDPLERKCLYQRMPVAVQRCNSICFAGSFVVEDQ